MMEHTIVEELSEKKGEEPCSLFSLKVTRSLSERSIRDHIDKLGLSKIKKSLPELMAGLKKTP